jgi:dynein heavy chain 2
MKDPKFEDTWASWVVQPNCEENWPSIEGQNIQKRGASYFTQLLLIAVLAPHRLVAAIESFVKNTLQLEQFSIPFGFGSLLSTDSALPIIFIVSAGADPSKEIEELCKKSDITLSEIAIGQCTVDSTVQQLRKCAELGHWLLLKNTHLSMSLVSRIEKEFASLTQKKPGFKLLLTTEPHRSFPPLLLANSIKISLEAPPGVRANLLRTLSTVDPSKLTRGQLKNIAAVAYFHSIIQERRIFIPQGWTKFYEFSSADFSCALQIIAKTSGDESSQFEYIRGLLGVAVYGGRVDNDFDFRILSLYLAAYVAEDANPLKLERNSKFNDLVNIVTKMNERDPPSLFFLPPNATKTVALSRKAESIFCLRRVSAIADDSGAIQRGQWAEKLSPLADRWNELLRRYPKLTDIKLSAPADDTPMAAALYSQYCIIHELLTNLALFFKSLDGFLHHGDALSHELIAKGQFLIRGEVPDPWFDVAEGPVVASEWLSEVARKADVIDALAQDPDLAKKPLELSSLVRPTAILDALRQQTARKTSIPIVDLKLVFGIGEETEDALFVTDIALQGAVLQGMKIAPMQKDDAIFVKCVNCAFSWKKTGAKQKTVDIPLYSNADRSKFIVSVPTLCQGDPKAFAFAGAAFILNR